MTYALSTAISKDIYTSKVLTFIRAEGIQQAGGGGGGGGSTLNHFTVASKKAGNTSPTTFRT